MVKVKFGQQLALEGVRYVVSVSATVTVRRLAVQLELGPWLG